MKALQMYELLKMKIIFQNIKIDISVLTRKQKHYYIKKRPLLHLQASANKLN